MPAMDAASVPATTPPQAPTLQRRKDYSEEDDVALLRQVLLDRPFASHGHWDTLAAKLVASPAFARSKLSGKNAQSRMNSLFSLSRGDYGGRTAVGRV
ncbi:hypothetical protein GQ600_23616 [Phytophthora cactorum]|nr:hypothetical protein GQ600_23616 [Phytophthora cactorum]